MHTNTQQDVVPRQDAAFTCTSGHEFTKTFAADVPTPPCWECPHCGKVGTPNSRTSVVTPVKGRKTHWDMLMERRSLSELSDMLLEYVGELRRSR